MWCFVDLDAGLRVGLGRLEVPSVASQSRRWADVGALVLVRRTVRGEGPVETSYPPITVLWITFNASSLLDTL
jgi:hypothetical protein